MPIHLYGSAKGDSTLPFTDISSSSGPVDHMAQGVEQLAWKIEPAAELPSVLGPTQN